MKLEHSLTSYTKINSKWIQDLNVRPDTIKLLEKNIGRKLYDVNDSTILFDPPPREMEIKTKINKWGQWNLKAFAQPRKPSTKQKDNPWNGREYLQMMWLTGLNTQSTQIAHKTQYQKPNNPVKKMSRSLEWTFFQRRHTDG